MRWGWAAFALVLSSCVSVSIATPPPSPSAPLPTIAARTAAPTATLRATPVIARPDASPGGTPGVAPHPTPFPTLGLPVVNAACAEWPRETEIFTLMTHLALPPSLCLLRGADAYAGKLVCTVVGCVPITNDCLAVGSCIQVVVGEEPHYVVVWSRAPAARDVAHPIVAPQLGEGYGIARRLCELHQERTLIDAGLRGRSWAATIEGAAFSAAFDFFRRAYPLDAARWGAKPSDVENYVDVCSAWYYPYVRDVRVDAFPSLREFGEKWLPK